MSVSAAFHMIAMQLIRYSHHGVECSMRPDAWELSVERFGLRIPGVRLQAY
jgi:hypothetical protein